MYDKFETNVEYKETERWLPVGGDGGRLNLLGSIRQMKGKLQWENIKNGNGSFYIFKLMIYFTMTMTHTNTKDTIFFVFHLLWTGISKAQYLHMFSTHRFFFVSFILVLLWKFIEFIWNIFLYFFIRSID